MDTKPLLKQTSLDFKTPSLSTIQNQLVSSWEPRQNTSCFTEATSFVISWQQSRDMTASIQAGGLCGTFRCVCFVDVLIIVQLLSHGTKKVIKIKNWWHRGEIPQTRIDDKENVLFYFYCYLSSRFVSAEDNEEKPFAQISPNQYQFALWGLDVRKSSSR